jgi:hypothetical protein
MRASLLRHGAERFDLLFQLRVNLETPAEISLCDMIFAAPAG